MLDSTLFDDSFCTLWAFNCFISVVKAALSAVVSLKAVVYLPMYLVIPVCLKIPICLAVLITCIIVYTCINLNPHPFNFVILHVQSVQLSKIIILVTFIEGVWRKGSFDLS